MRGSHTLYAILLFSSRIFAHSYDSGRNLNGTAIQPTNAVEGLPVTHIVASATSFSTPAFWNYNIVDKTTGLENSKRVLLITRNSNHPKTTEKESSHGKTKDTKAGHAKTKGSKTSGTKSKKGKAGEAKSSKPVHFTEAMLLKSEKATTKNFHVKLTEGKKAAKNPHPVAGGKVKSKAVTEIEAAARTKPKSVVPSGATAKDGKTHGATKGSTGHSGSSPKKSQSKGKHVRRELAKRASQELGMGEMGSARDGESLVTDGLNTCMGLVLMDPQTQYKVGMHFSPGRFRKEWRSFIKYVQEVFNADDFPHLWNSHGDSPRFERLAIRISVPHTDANYDIETFAGVSHEDALRQREEYINEASSLFQKAGQYFDISDFTENDGGTVVTVVKRHRPRWRHGTLQVSVGEVGFGRHGGVIMAEEWDDVEFS